MLDMAEEWQRTYAACWFVVPQPRQPFVNGVGRPAVWQLLTSGKETDRPHVIMPSVGDEYEFGTEAYRAGVYVRGIRQGIPPRVPIIVSDDPSAWRAAALVSDRNPFIAVVHADLREYDGLVRRYAPHVSAFVGVSRRVTARVRGVLSDDRFTAETIPCGIRLPEMPRRLHAPQDPIRIAWVGRMREASKRISDLPKIAACLRERQVAFSMEIMGDGEERSTLLEELSRRQLTDVVRVLPWGTPTDVQSLLSRADVMLLPSNLEGMPIAVMEALALGCGVVASRVSGIEDYERHALAEGCFWVYPVGDVSAAGSAIERAKQTDPIARSSRARGLAEAEFSIARCVERYAEFAQGLMPATPLRPGFIERHSTLRGLVSVPIAAQRIARLWIRGRYQRPEPVVVR